MKNLSERWALRGPTESPVGQPCPLALLGLSITWVDKPPAMPRKFTPPSCTIPFPCPMAVKMGYPFPVGAAKTFDRTIESVAGVPSDTGPKSGRGRRRCNCLPAPILVMKEWRHKAFRKTFEYDPVFWHSNCRPGATKWKGSPLKILARSDSPRANGSLGGVIATGAERSRAKKGGRACNCLPGSDREANCTRVDSAPRKPFIDLEADQPARRSREPAILSGIYGPQRGLRRGRSISDDIRVLGNLTPVYIPRAIFA